jgi:putative DNA primase/helicase
MKMKYKITTFKNRFASEGTSTEKTIEEMYLAFKHKVKRTKNTYSEYLSTDKHTQTQIKDVGGYVGGETQGNRRTSGTKITRQLLTLDIDTKLPNILPYLERNINFYCIVHSTHRHSSIENRFRIIAPLSREVNEDEYEAVGRRIAFSIENNENETLQGLFDETTFQANRMMFFPSVSCDGEYICELFNLDMTVDEQNIIDVDRVLDEYLDRNNIYEWFKPERIDNDRVGEFLSKTPLKARGMVGAFNRTFTITETIEKFLPDVYKKETNGRYTFVGGDSFGGGIVLKDDTLFYSHHGTDPANMYYRSAFDLVRIHKFGSFDVGFTPEKIIEKEIVDKTESFKKMVEFCRSIPEVVQHSESNVALRQRLENQDLYIEKNFGDEIKPEETQDTEDDKSWIVALDGVKSVFAKLDTIFSNDKNLKDLFYFDTFRANICFQRKPFWQKEFTDGQALQDKDMAHIRGYLDRVYNIKGEKVIDDATVVEADKVQKNKMMSFFETLVWDKKERIETFFNEFFNVELNPFTRVAFKHWLVGAVSRIYRAGSPFDLLLVIKGKQGVGKSLFFKKLATPNFSDPGEHLYSDTKIDFDKAKDSYEQLEGVWIYEWKELAGMNMSEQESIKAFVDKTEDKFRRSYGRRNVEIKRRVAFGGSTNDKTPLRDRTGNRRFLVYDSPLAQNECYIKDERRFSEEYRNQLLAEAIHLYKSGFNIFAWSNTEIEWWDRSNESNLADNDLLGAIQSYVSMKRPRNWYSMSIDEMIEYVNNYDFERDRPKTSIWSESTGMLERIGRVCVPELWKVALKQRELTINRYHRELLLQAVENLGWINEKQQQRFGIFGHQKIIVPKIKKELIIDDEDLPF